MRHRTQLDIYLADNLFLFGSKPAVILPLRIILNRGNKITAYCSRILPVFDQQGPSSRQRLEKTILAHVDCIYIYHTTK